jgi:hypothetical protein
VQKSTKNKVKIHANFSQYNVERKEALELIKPQDWHSSGLFELVT